ncbi:MAG: hypothetical protein Q8O67_21610 [Deltaproteobacteria bacterium]|nr:hypothetical protein [Deltaproteobacteria bacterium]
MHKLCLSFLPVIIAAGVACPVTSTGDEGGSCFANDTCNGGLSCFSDRCVVDDDREDGDDDDDGGEGEGEGESGTAAFDATLNAYCTSAVACGPSFDPPQTLTFEECLRQVRPAFEDLRSTCAAGNEAPLLIGVDCLAATLAENCTALQTPGTCSAELTAAQAACPGTGGDGGDSLALQDVCDALADCRNDDDDNVDDEVLECYDGSYAIESELFAEGGCSRDAAGVFYDYARCLRDVLEAREECLTLTLDAPPPGCEAERARFDEIAATSCPELEAHVGWW